MLWTTLELDDENALSHNGDNDNSTNINIKILTKLKAYAFNISCIVKIIIH